MTTGVRNLLWAVFLGVGLTACGGGDGGGGGGASNAKDVQIADLAGTWFGTFDDGSVHDFELTINGSTISDVKLDGTALNLSGTITKADTTTEGERTFRFSLSNGTSEVARGVLVSDSNGTHLTYMDRFRQGGALQKGTPPATAPTFAQTDINNGSYDGDRVTSTSGTSGTFESVNVTRVNGPCKATAPATTPATSECDLALSGSVSRKLTGVQVATKGKFDVAGYTDTPTGSATAPNGKLFMTADKSFVGGWTCANGSGDPAACDVYALRK